MKPQKIAFYAAAFSIICGSVYHTTMKARNLPIQESNYTTTALKKNEQNEFFVAQAKQELMRDYPIDGINLSQDYRQQIFFNEVEPTDKFNVFNVNGKLRNKKGVQSFTGKISFTQVSNETQNVEAYMDGKESKFPCKQLFGDMTLKLKNNHTINFSYQAAILTPTKHKDENHLRQFILKGTELDPQGKIVGYSNQSNNLEAIGLDIYDRASEYERTVPIKKEYVAKGWDEWQEWSEDDHNWYARK